MKISLIILQLSLILLSGNAYSAKITHKEIAADEYMFMLNNDSYLEINQAQKLIETKAISTCKDKKPLYGKYKFEGAQPVSDTAETTPYHYKQHVKCVDKINIKSPQSPFLLTSSDKNNIKETAKELTINYFSLKESGAYKQAYTLLTDSMQEITKYDHWKNKEEKYFSNAGNLINRDIWKVTIYNNPVQSPKPGIYVATDYEFEYDNYVSLCGYVIWYRPNNGSLKYKVMREEYGYIDKKTLSKLKPHELTNMRTQLRCKAI